MYGNVSFPFHDCYNSDDYLVHPYLRNVIRHDPVQVLHQFEKNTESFYYYLHIFITIYTLWFN